jgi:hypothetical protein
MLPLPALLLLLTMARTMQPMTAVKALATTTTMMKKQGATAAMVDQSSHPPPPQTIILMPMDYLMIMTPRGLLELQLGLHWIGLGLHHLRK